MPRTKDPELTKVIARNIRAIRIARGLNQKQLQVKVGWKYQAMVSQLETGAVGVGPATLRKLADALEVKPAILYMEELPEEFQAGEYTGEHDESGSGNPSRAKKGMRRLRSPVRVPIFDLDDVTRGRLDIEKSLGEFKYDLPIELMQKKDLVIMLVRRNSENTGPLPLHNDFVVIDRSDCNPPIQRNFSDVYVIRTAKGILFRYIALEDGFIKLFEHDHDNNPISLDIRAYSTPTEPIIGKVIFLKLPYKNNSAVA